MEPLRPAARLYLAVLVLAALGAAVVALARASVPDPERLTLAVALTGMALLAWLFPLHIAAKTKLYFDNAVLVAAIILFEPGIALLVMGVGTVLAHALRREPWDQTLFNTAQVVLLTVVGGGFLAATGWQVDQLALDRLEPLLLIVAVSVALMVGSTLVVATMVALQLNEPLPYAWAGALLGIDRTEALADLAQVGLGLLVAGLADAHSWMLALLLLPAASTYRALEHHVRLRRDAEARLIHQAFHDPLTDLPNRALLLDHLEQALARAERRDEPVALLFLDLDRYKLVNDRLGHTAGDHLLVSVADRLQGCARPGDTVARLGGDEFTVLLDGVADAAEAERITANIAVALEAPFTLDSHEVSVTASIGLVVTEPGQVMAPAELLRDADVAMYWAKARGRARYTRFEPAMGDIVRERAELAADLRRVLKQGQLQLDYQPVVELATGRIVAVEALARWEHPARGPIPPDEFVPLAEEAGLIASLGQWALGAACQQARTWQDTLPAAPTVAVNFSPRQFQQPGLIEDVAEALRTTGLASHLLALEITEGAMIANADEAVSTLRQLKGLGIGLGIGDFGTGYSNLSYLQRLPVDQLKVDQQFVEGLGRDAGDAAIVRAVVELARTLGLVVVAEGVETARQAAWLQELGCPLAQGFYFGRPQSAKALTALLATEPWVEKPRALRVV